MPPGDPVRWKDETAANSGLTPSGHSEGEVDRAANISPERLRRRISGTNAQLKMYPPGLAQTHEPPPEPQEHHAPELELQLLRNGVRSMAAGRWACSSCGRSPLIGERLQVFADGTTERLLCALCLAEAPERGEPLRTVRVRAGRGRLNVRRAA